MKPKVLVATDISNIKGLWGRLSSIFEIIYYPNITEHDIPKVDADIQAIFTNPNNCKIYYGKESLARFTSLKTLATASTGTIHIDKEYCSLSGIELVSITKSISVLEKITSTAELAFLLTLSAARKYDLSRRSVDELKWDYFPFLGRQLNSLTIGVLGFGRLGKMFAGYCKAFGAKVLICDPAQADQAKEAGYMHVDMQSLFKRSEIVSIHIHAEEKNLRIINKEVLGDIARPFSLVNTSRGEIVDESSILSAAEENPEFFYFSDVISNEHLGVENCPLRLSEFYGRQIFLTPHCGGMTHDARQIAYSHAADLLLTRFR